MSVRTHTTNVGSLRTGDVIPEGFAGFQVHTIQPEHDSAGGCVTLTLYSLQTGARMDWTHQHPTRPVEIVHPDDHGKPIPPDVERAAVMARGAARKAAHHARRMAR